jgi:hypothetical protein
MSLPTHQGESSPLLISNGNHETTQPTRGALPTGNPKARLTIWTILTLVFVLMLVILLRFQDILSDGFKSALGILPKDPLYAAHVILRKAPVIVSAHSNRFQTFTDVIVDFISGWTYR